MSLIKDGLVQDYGKEDSKGGGRKGQYVRAGCGFGLFLRGGCKALLCEPRTARF